MDTIRTIGEGMKPFSKKQILNLEINALCVLTQGRALNAKEKQELRGVTDEHRAALPALIMCEHLMCDCFTKHIWN
jgi:hypothetical protein